MKDYRSIWLLHAATIIFVVIVAGCTVASSGNSGQTDLISVEVFITTTPDPNITPDIQIVTATVDRTQDALLTATVLPTSTFDASQSLDERLRNLPPSCLTHTVVDGNTFFGVAAEYGVDPFAMLEINDMTEETATLINIGDILIIPAGDCFAGDAQTVSGFGVEVTAEVSPEVTILPENLTPSPIPSITLVPTATNFSLEIVEILRMGDVTAEAVLIRNNGQAVDLRNWTLSDTQGNVFVFQQLRLFQNQEHSVYTRSGQNVPLASYWGLQRAVWQVGDTVTLSDADGTVQAEYQILDETDTP